MPTIFGSFDWIYTDDNRAAIGIFILVKYLNHKKNKKQYAIQNVHVIAGDGSELFHQNVYIKAGSYY